jgi:hypothetical protein
MEYTLATRDGGTQDFRIVDAALNEIDPMREHFEIARLAGRKIVENADLPAIFDEMFNQMRTNESGAAGNQAVTHGGSPFLGGIVRGDLGCSQKLHAFHENAWISPKGGVRETMKSMRARSGALSDEPDA